MDGEVPEGTYTASSRAHVLRAPLICDHLSPCDHYGPLA